MQEAVRRRIRLIDYEYLTDGEARVVAFGRWAGIVGAYNGLRALGLRRGDFELKPAHRCFDLSQVREELVKISPGNTRIAVTGGGRVANGALEILSAAGIAEVSPEAFLGETHPHAVFTRLDPWHYTRRSDGADFDFGHFVEHPDRHENNLLPYAARTDLLMACHYWDPSSPVMLTREDLRSGAIPISVIADISCNIGQPIASTIRASTIADPFYGYDPATGKETRPFENGAITVMAVDNLPGELPRDASEDFGEALVRHVIPGLIGERDSGMLNRASITRDGRLTSAYAYLQDFLEGS